MRKISSKLILLAATAIAGAGFLSSCSSKPVIGILQPVEHAALAEARNGFIDALKSEGFEDGKNMKIDYRNAQGVDANMSSAAKSLVSKAKLNLGIGTGASQMLKAAEINAGVSTPLLFTAVTDPVQAALVENINIPEGFVTGTSDANPVKEQIDIIKQCIPTADKIGILYTQSEVNSQVQATQAQAQAEDQGLTVEVKTCTSSADIKASATALCGIAGIDAIYIPTDNNLAANMNAVKDACDAQNVLCVCAERGEVETGGHITFSFSYFALGQEAGKMAAAILKGEKEVKDIPVGYMGVDQCKYIYDESAINSLGITLPQTILNNSEKL